MPCPRPLASESACHICSALRPASRTTPWRSEVSVASRLPTTCGCSLPAVGERVAEAVMAGLCLGRRMLGCGRRLGIGVQAPGRSRQLGARPRCLEPAPALVALGLGVVGLAVQRQHIARAAGAVGGRRWGAPAQDPQAAGARGRELVGDRLRAADASSPSSARAAAYPGSMGRSSTVTGRAWKAAWATFQAHSQALQSRLVAGPRGEEARGRCPNLRLARASQQLPHRACARAEADDVRSVAQALNVYQAIVGRRSTITARSPEWDGLKRSGARLVRAAQGLPCSPVVIAMRPAGRSR